MIKMISASRRTTIQKTEILISRERLVFLSCSDSEWLTLEYPSGFL
jgi:hypothetical protein